jgi:O-antigen/teichoic acid export membrane protein
MLSITVARSRGPQHADARASALSTALIGNTGLGIVTGMLVALAASRLVHHQSTVPVLAGIAAFFTCTNAVWLGLYQGERRFPLQSGLRTTDSVTKAIVGVGLAVLGFGLAGAIGGVIAGASLVTLWGALRVRGFGRPHRWIDRTVLPTVAWTAVAQLGFGLLMNMDILAVRALGTSTAAGAGAGYYQAASVLARAPVFVGLAFLNAVFPFLAGTAGDAVAEARLLRTSLRAITLVPIPMAVLLLAAPGPAVRLFFPATYAPAIPLLRLNAAAALSLLALGTAVLSLQATRGMRSAARAILPAVLMETLTLTYAVPRYGPEGAAWSLLLASSAGAVLVWIPAVRRWPLRAIAPSPRLAVALLALGVAAALLPVHGRLWVVEAVLLGVGFWLTVWALRGISAAEIVPLAPAPIRPLLEWVAAREPGGN